MSNARRIIIVSVLLSMFFGCSSYQQSAWPVAPDKATPACSITARQSDGDILVRITIANGTRSDLPLLKWNLPLDGRLTTDLFAVTRNGTKIPYKGPMVKRRVTAESYITIASGKAFSKEVSLQQGYDVSAPGEYEIQYRAHNQQLPNAEGSAVSRDLEELASPAIHLSKR